LQDSRVDRLEQDDQAALENHAGQAGHAGQVGQVSKLDSTGKVARTGQENQGGLKVLGMWQLSSAWLSEALVEASYVDQEGRDGQGGRKYQQGHVVDGGAPGSQGDQLDDGGTPFGEIAGAPQAIANNASATVGGTPHSAVEKLCEVTGGYGILRSTVATGYTRIKGPQRYGEFLIGEGVRRGGVESGMSVIL
jgi:hypothetical protein